MTKKLFLIRKDSTKVILYNKDRETLVECQKINGEWCVKKDDGYFQPLQEKEFFRLIAGIGWFRPHRNEKKPFKTVFNVSVASEYLNLGYTVLDTATFTSFKRVDNVLVNAMELPQLPEGTYILNPFQDYILPAKKEKLKIKPTYKREQDLMQKKILEDKTEQQKRRISKRLHERPFVESPKRAGFWSQLGDWLIAASLVGIIVFALNTFFNVKK